MRVMLIEDDALVRAAVLEALDAEGMEVSGLASAEDALILLGAGQVPDVLVANVHLGQGLSGLDLVAIARERHPGLEAVLISGQAVAPGRAPPHLRFLRKPFPPDALSQAIRDAAAEAEREAERGAEQRAAAAPVSP
jgi:DNA-binding NtrC family response regulator